MARTDWKAATEAAKAEAEAKTARAAPKKGRRSWGAQNALHVSNQEAGYVYRWETNDDSRLEHRLSEGWEVCRDARKENRALGVEDGKPLTSADTYREMVKLRLPVEIAEDRRAFYQQEAEAQIQSITGPAQSQVDSRAGRDYPVHGGVQIIRS